MSGFFWPPRGQGAAPRARLGGNGGSGGSVPVSMRGRPGMRSLRSFLPQKSRGRGEAPQMGEPQNAARQRRTAPSVPVLGTASPQIPPGASLAPLARCCPFEASSMGLCPTSSTPSPAPAPSVPSLPSRPGAAGKLGSGQNETSFPLPSWVTISAPRELGGHQPAPESTAPRGAAAPASRRSQHKHLCCL